MPELGRAALIATLGLVLYAVVAGAIAAWTRRRRLAASAQNALVAAFATTLVASAVLLAALARNDFSFVYVAQHTSRELPTGYTISAFWGGQEGSLLLWLLILTGYAAAAVFLNRRSARDNYNDETALTSKNSVNFDNWTDIFTSQLFFIALGLCALGIVVGAVAGRRTAQPFDRSPSSLGPVVVGLFFLSCAVLSSIRGTIFNNVWWVIVVTSLATALGLAVAVLADRAKAENAAKSLVFLPMAISFIGAGIIWRFMYQARDV